MEGGGGGGGENDKLENQAEKWGSDGTKTSKEDFTAATWELTITHAKKPPQRTTGPHSNHQGSKGHHLTEAPGTTEEPWSTGASDSEETGKTGARQAKS